MPQNVDEILAQSKKILEKASDFPKMPQAEKPAPDKHEFSGVSYKSTKSKPGSLSEEAQSLGGGLRAKGQMIQKAQKALE
jgi:hypothetical protein